MEDPTFPIPKLPNDVIIEILTWLPVKPLLKFKCVCKSWRALISCQQFVKAHLKTLKSDPNLNYSILIPEHRGEFTNGKLYWIAYRGHDLETGWDILSFDLEKEEEEYEILQMPSYVKTSIYSRLQMCGGSLCLICTHETCTDVWIMDGCSVGIDKWTKVATIPYSDNHWDYMKTCLLYVEKNGGPVPLCFEICGI